MMMAKALLRREEEQLKNQGTWLKVLSLGLLILEKVKVEQPQLYWMISGLAPLLSMGFKLGILLTTNLVWELPRFQALDLELTCLLALVLKLALLLPVTLHLTFLNQVIQDLDLDLVLKNCFLQDEDSDS